MRLEKNVCHHNVPKIPFEITIGKADGRWRFNIKHAKF
jgi:hypothetical protein